LAEYQVLYWREIPAQVRVFDGRRPVSAKMPERFQEEIDRVAMEEGLEGSDDYLDQWKWTKKLERPGTVDEIIEALLAQLEEEHDNRDL
jgi:hypothetical protein